MTAISALDKACAMALVSPYTSRVMAQVALERACQESNWHVANAALSLYVVLMGNFRRAGMA